MSNENIEINKTEAIVGLMGLALCSDHVNAIKSIKTF